jgi:predicted porin
VKRTIISAAAILAFAAAAHADELTDIQAQAKQLREQNAAMTKRLAELEKRQKALETQSVAKPVATVNPVDALAADLPYKAAVKAKAPESDDVCWHGVCLYGNFDMGLSYNQHGSPLSSFIGPLNYLAEKANNGSYFGVGANQFSTSFLGLRGRQEVADNLYAVFNLQTLFNPQSGTGLNGVGGIAQNNGLGASPALGNLANAYGDSSKAGQLFNNVAYFGISSPTYGTFTMGRQSALTSDLVTNYDALAGSNAWSLITYEGASGGGGDTEDRIFDNSYEYRLNVGPVRFAAEAQIRNGGNSSTGNAFQGDVGFDYQGLSMDFVGGKIYDANSVGTTLSTGQVNALTSNQAGGAAAAGQIGPGYAIPCSLGCLSGVISDNTVFQVAAKYTIGQWKFYGGYEHLTFANPDNPLQPGAFAAGGYNIAFVNDNNYFTNRNQSVFWAGVKYAVTPTLDIAASYYGIRQGFYLVGAGPGDAIAGTATFSSVPGNALAGKVNGVANANQAAACAALGTASPGCSGALDMVSLVMDWRFARHFDFYAGVAYSQKTGGLASGFVLATNNTATNVNNRVSTYDPGIGLRYQF